MTAADKILQKALVGSKLDTAGWSEVQAGLRDRAFFSARIEEARILDAARRMCAEVADGKLSASEFRRDMRQVLDQTGYSPDGEGIRDMRTRARLDVIRETQVRQARGWAQWREGTTEGALAAFPAQELVRVRERKMPRDWASRWAANGGRTYGGRMVALKNDPVWVAISRFGVPWPPFDFGSGMGVRDIGWDEAVELGLLKDDDPPPEMPGKGFNDGLSAKVQFDEHSREWPKLKETFGDQIQLVDGEIQWRGNLIRENFDKGGKFTMRLGAATKALTDMLAARRETEELGRMLEGKGQFVVTQQWLDNPRKHGGDHRAHFAPMPEYPDDKPLTLGDCDLIPSIWRKPDRAFNAGEGHIALEIDSFEGDMFRLIVKVSKGAPRLKTFYRTARPYEEKQ